MDTQLHTNLIRRLDLVVHKFENFQRQSKALNNELATEVASESIAEIKAVVKLANALGRHTEDNLSLGR